MVVVPYGEWRQSDPTERAVRPMYRCTGLRNDAAFYGVREMVFSPVLKLAARAFNAVTVSIVTIAVVSSALDNTFAIVIRSL